MEWVESAAFGFLLSAGCSRDPMDFPGLSNFTCEMAQRGAGDRDSRQFVEALEDLGVDRSAAVSNGHTSFGGATLATNLYKALDIYADILRDPHLPERQMDEGLLVCLQELRAIKDDLSQRVMMQLRARQYPDPWGRSAYGTEKALRSISIRDIQRHHQQYYCPNESILSVAGRIEWPRLLDHVGQLLEDWQPVEQPKIVETPVSEQYLHIQHESNQTHIGIGYASVPYAAPSYYQARGAVGVLSDGMSSRLFTEVREKRGLCYSVYASTHSLKDRGSVLCYCGTSSERAQQSLDVMMAELVRLAEGIEQQELGRLKARVKSSLIMQQESSRARAAAIATDWHLLGRVQTLDELSQVIDGLTCDSINRYLAENPPTDFQVVTLGSQALEVPVEVS